MQEFARVLEERMESQTTDSIEQSWREFSNAIIEALTNLLMVPKKGGRDWMMGRVCEVSRMQQEAWMHWVKKPDDSLLKAQYQQLKAQCWKAVDEAG